MLQYADVPKCKGHLGPVRLTPSRHDLVEEVMALDRPTSIEMMGPLQWQSDRLFPTIKGSARLPRAKTVWQLALWNRCRCFQGLLWGPNGSREGLGVGLARFVPFHIGLRTKYSVQRQKLRWREPWSHIHNRKNNAAPPLHSIVGDRLVLMSNPWHERVRKRFGGTVVATCIAFSPRMLLCSTRSPEIGAWYDPNRRGRP